VTRGSYREPSKITCSSVPFDFVERGAQAGDHLSVDPVEWWGADRQERKRAA
jgi:hypothetical protein